MIFSFKIVVMHAFHYHMETNKAYDSCHIVYIFNTACKSIQINPILLWLPSLPPGCKSLIALVFEKCHNFHFDKYETADHFLKARVSTIADSWCLGSNRDVNNSRQDIFLISVPSN